MERKPNFTNSTVIEKPKVPPAPAAPPPVFKRKMGLGKWMVLGLAGMILLFIGGIWVTYVTWYPPPQMGDYEHYQDYTKDLNAWKNLTRTGNLYGRLVMDGGAFLLMLMGFIGLFDAELNDSERKIMLALGLFGTLILVIISVGIYVYSPYGYT